VKPVMIRATGDSQLRWRDAPAGPAASRRDDPPAAGVTLVPLTAGHFPHV
jgi:hypothetical protein